MISIFDFCYWLFIKILNTRKFILIYFIFLSNFIPLYTFCAINLSFKNVHLKARFFWNQFGLILGKNWNFSLLHDFANLMLQEHLTIRRFQNLVVLIHFLRIGWVFIQDPNLLYHFKFIFIVTFTFFAFFSFSFFEFKFNSQRDHFPLLKIYFLIISITLRIFFFFYWYFHDYFHFFYRFLLVEIQIAPLKA